MNSIQYTRDSEPQYQLRSPLLRIVVSSLLCFSVPSSSFSTIPPVWRTRNGHSTHSGPSISSKIPHLRAASSSGDTKGKKLLRSKIQDNRKKNDLFKLDRFSGRIEFGSTAFLATELEESENINTISQWLSDERRIALCIWDESLLEELGNQIYRLQVMTLQFVTISLAPRVDVQMWTELPGDDTGNNDRTTPVFRLESVAFDPNIQILPGISFSGKDLGIQIDVLGELFVSKSGKGIEGNIAFMSSGVVPPPMRLVPDVVLKGATDLICRQIVNFATESFQKGVRKEYKKFKELESSIM